MDLFADRGYAATSTEQVAAAADVSRSTLFRYFADKDDLVFGVEDDLLAALGTAVREAAAGRTPREAVQQATVSLAGEVASHRELLIDRERVVATSPALAARAAAKHRRWEATLARALQDSYPLTPSGASLLAKVAVACFEVADRAWLDDGTVDLAAEVDEAFRSLPALLLDVGGS